LQLINLYRLQKKWPDALNQARAAQSAFSGDIGVRDMLGRTYLDAGDLTNSVATYRDAVKAFPNSVQMQASYATVAAMAKDYPTAEAALTKAMSLDPNNEDLKAGLVGVVYADKGPAAALAQVKNLPNSSQVSGLNEILTADVLVKSGKRADAIAYMEKAQAANPNANLTLKLASLYEGDPDLKRSIALLERWTKDHKEDVTPRLQLAQYYGRVHNYPSARAAFEQLANERPSDAIILNNLAWLYGRTNDPKARQMAERAYQLAPNSPQIADTLGWIMTTQGDPVNAMRYLQIALNSMPNDPDVQYHYALALSRNNKAADARVVLQKVLAPNADFESKNEAQQLLNRLGQPQPQPAAR
jgi:putative PEP-CTERM system TPR-repeat lipoprotein